MKKTFIQTTQLFLSASFMVAGLVACQPAKERPARVDTKIADQIIPLKNLSADAEVNSETEKNRSNLIQKMIAKISDDNRRENAKRLLSENKLDYWIDEGKAYLIEIDPTKNNRKTISSEMTMNVVAEFKISTGILEHERTDYNEKKSILTLSPTNLDQAEYLMIEEEISKEEIKADASDVDSK